MLDGVLTETEGGGWWCQEWHRYVQSNSDVCHNDDEWDENTTKKNYDDDVEDDYDDDGCYHDDDDIYIMVKCLYVCNVFAYFIFSLF